MSVKRRNKFNLLPNFEACSVALFAACAIGAAVGAHAQSPNGNAGRSRSGDTAFSRADTNKDGKLSRDEAKLLPAISERFDEIDADRDQFISRSEFEEALKH
ncbi:hypothetical protein RD110_00575 [Rhodoferax koreense]|uniref:EF-hand domain-containing protein n=1 Tax=Rhodoferax koreensis TaxID=1842727 RepID=A0A1P8JQ76_9BURK|nr:EF-hand domain-containing protein [Rhodoferax koreense]APW35888.1 hypothetical protein RD110_00575 [Rhodoferax koreense]